jgi:peptidyl-prolyl cis-trans isomerase A (cyclophilin A)
MNLTRTILPATLALAFSAFAMAQQTPAKPAEELPDAPQATAAAMVHPNGPTVVMDTSMGRITCQFYEKQAPKAVANFIGLAEGTIDWTDPVTKKKQRHKRYYDGTIFHRVIPEFMIQGGDPTGTGMGDPGYAFEDEIDPNLNFDGPGKLAMANSGPNTNGSQFFITEQAYDSLNQHYVLFGQCDDSSVEVVKTIARVERDGQDKPLTPVYLNKVTIVREGQPIPPQPGAAEPVPAPASASAPAVPAKTVAISGGVAMGLLQVHVPPHYPIEAKQAGVSGTVVLSAVIGTDGSVNDLRVISGPEPLQQAALDAVNQWRYRPYLLNGKPVEVKTTVNVVFTLGK